MANKDDNLKIVSLNVRGLSNFRKRWSIFNWCRKSKADIILLQETHSTKALENQWRSEWGGQIFFSHGSNDSRGVAIACNNGSNVNVKQIHGDNYGRILSIDFQKNELDFNVTNIYAPNIESQQTQFYIDLKQFCIDKDFESKDRLIIGGDFNCVLNPKVDKKGGNVKVKENVVKNIKEIIDTFDLIDIWRYLNPDVHRYTWRQNNPLIQCRLDYFLMSDSLIEYVKDCDIGPGLRTDHSSIKIDFQLQREFKRGPGHWKFNNSLLEDQNFVLELTNNLNGWVKDNSVSDNQVKWEWIKFKIREFSIRFAKNKSKSKKDKLTSLNEKLNQLENNLAVTPSEDLLQQINNVKNCIENLDAKIVDGMIVRSRIQWSEKGEKSNKYFLGLEKRNSRKKHCKKIVDETGSVTVDPIEIVNLQGDYYKKLYESKYEDEDGENSLFFEGQNIPTLNEDENKICEGDLNIGECYNVLKNMAKNKSPGNDGLLSEFYLCFWNVIGNLLVAVLNTGLHNGKPDLFSKTSCYNTSCKRWKR